jgi:hypothetical protein
MTANLRDILKEAFENIDDLSADKIGKLSTESAAFFASLQAGLNSSDGKTKESAYRSALEMKEYLEARLKQLSEETGLDFDTLVNLARDTQYKKELFAPLRQVEGAPRAPVKSKIKTIIN